VHRSKIVTLTTDFGNSDAYVAAMKGRILSITPEVNIVDVSHEIEPGNILQAAFVLSGSLGFFPEGTVHLVVVDPTVGSPRRGLAISSGGHFFVGPDNGVFTLFLGGASVHELKRKEFFAKDISPTFHGRDIFAPVAAHLALGASVEAFGPEVSDPTLIEIPEPRIEKDKRIRGEVIHIDRFGNLVTNIKEELITDIVSGRRELNVVVKGRLIRGLKRYYSQGPKGELLALIGSSGHLEIAVSGGSARSLLAARVGTEVEVAPAAPP